MKEAHTILFFMSLIFIVSTNETTAQSKTDYFVGTWKVIVKETPNGDSPMTFHLDSVQGKLQGEIKFEGVEEPSVFTEIVENENSITLYFMAAGYDVNLHLEKKDENQLQGNMLDMFVAEGERLVEN